MLKGKVALVAGATRGAGRAIAVELGRMGATLYCSGRSTREKPSELGCPETIEDTADAVYQAGGKAFAHYCDHNSETQVQHLIERILLEQGKLDILVNDIWGGEKRVEWGKKFWELDLNKGFKLLENSIFTHIITSKYAVQPMLQAGSGLIIEVTDGNTWEYRPNFFYDLVKTGIMRLTHNQARELHHTGITVLSVTPGFLRSEEMLEHFAVTPETWRDAILQDPYFAGSETPHFVGKAIAHLASDPQHQRFHGQYLSSWQLSEVYNFSDIDGNTPHWGNFFASMQNSAQSS